MNIQCNGLYSEIPASATTAANSIMSDFCTGGTLEAYKTTLKDNVIPLLKTFNINIPTILQPAFIDLVATMTSTCKMDLCCQDKADCKGKDTAKISVCNLISKLASDTLGCPATSHTSPSTVSPSARNTISQLLITFGPIIGALVVLLLVQLVRGLVMRRKGKMYWTLSFLLFFMLASIWLVIMTYDPGCWTRTCTESAPLTVPSGAYTGKASVAGVTITAAANIDFSLNRMTLSKLSCTGSSCPKPNDMLEKCKDSKQLTIDHANETIMGFPLVGSCVSNIEAMGSKILKGAFLRQEKSQLYLVLSMQIKFITYPNFKVALTLVS